MSWLTDAQIQRLSDAWDARHNPWDQDYEDDPEYLVYETHDRHGKIVDVCTCPAYPFPHRLGSGQCDNDPNTISTKRP